MKLENTQSEFLSQGSTWIQSNSDQFKNTLLVPQGAILRTLFNIFPNDVAFLSDGQHAELHADDPIIYVIASCTTGHRKKTSEAYLKCSTGFFY